jgi:hypothetical protein
MSWTDVRDRYLTATSDDGRTKALFNSEREASPELVGFLRDIAADPKAFDLARIEAIKSLGLAASSIATEAEGAARALLTIAISDPDHVVQSFALQGLEWFPENEEVARGLQPLLAPTVHIDVRHAALAALRVHKRLGAAREALEGLLQDPELGKAARRILQA